MAFAGMQLQMVHLDELGTRLSGLRLCRPKADEHMRQSLERHGQLTGVAVFDDGDELQLVDGFKRLRAARKLGWTSMQARVLMVDEATAAAVMGALHDHGGLTEIEEGWIVRHLHREHGLSQGAVAQLLRRHKSWVSRRLLLAEGLDAAVQIDVRLGLLSPRSAIAVAALTRGNQRRAADLVMERGMTTRQAESMARRLQALGSDEARAALMRDWSEPLTDGKTSLLARPHSARELILADVAILMRVGVRLEVRLLDMPVQVDDAQLVGESLRRLDELLIALGSTIVQSLRLQEKAHATLANP